jgi:hypothetical protein
MSWFLLAWAYLVAGEITALLALADEETSTHVQWLAYRRSWWLPYAGAAAFVIAWPAAVTLVLFYPKKKN